MQHRNKNKQSSNKQKEMLKKCCHGIEIFLQKENQNTNVVLLVFHSHYFNNIKKKENIFILFY